MMMKCWQEEPADRPTFQDVRETFEAMMSRENPYLDFSVLDESRDYYHVPSFNSASNEDNEADDEKEIPEIVDVEQEKDINILDEHQIKASPLLLNISKPTSFLDLEAAMNRRSTISF